MNKLPKNSGTPKAAANTVVNTTEVPKRKSYVPTRKITTALLGEEIANNWASHFSHINIANLQPSDMLNSSITLKRLVEENNNNVSLRKINTLMLSQLNKQIDRAIIALKNYIKGQYAITNNSAAIYHRCGMTMGNNQNFSLPADNTIRTQSLSKIVDFMNEANNPLAMLNFGLHYWTDTLAKHHQLWEQSNEVRQNVSNIALQTDMLMDTVQRNLKQVRKTLEIVYEGIELKRQKRYIGFLKESL